MTGDEMVALSKQPHALRVVGAGRGGSDSGGARQGRPLLDAGRQALHRLQQPVDVRQRRPRRPARHQGHPGAGRVARLRQPVHGHRAARAAGREAGRRSRPGDIDVFFFTNGGAEANENAIRIARAVTGRHKILARYRSYHGGTAGSLTLTGDPRRWAAEPGMPGVVHVLDPYHGMQRGWDTRGRVAGASSKKSSMLEGPQTHRRLHPRDGHRHQRHPGAARRLPAGRARALRQARHPADLRRGDGRLRPHRQVVRASTTGTSCPTSSRWPRA